MSGAPWRSFPCALLLLLVLCASPAAAAPWSWDRKDRKTLKKLFKSVRKVGGTWSVETPNWIVQTEVSPAFTAETALYMERIAEQLTKVLSGLTPRVKARRKPTVHVFAREGSYKRLFADGSRGHYRYKFAETGAFTELHLYTFLKPQEKSFSRFYHPILMHEGTHVWLRRHLGQTPCPTWLDEGLATWFQFWDLRLNTERNRKTRYARSPYRKLLAAAGKTPSLERLLSIKTPKVWNPDSMGPKANQNYALSESLVDFFLSTKSTQSAFGKLFRRVLASKPLLDVKQLEALEREWWQHLRRIR